VRPVGLRGPTDDEIRASMENAAIAPRFGVKVKGVYRYRNHAEANAAAERWKIEAMVRRQIELAGVSDRLGSKR
jgi:hypothetical protein